MSWQINIQKLVNAGLIGKKSCKKQKVDILNKTLLSFIQKTNKL